MPWALSASIPPNVSSRSKPVMNRAGSTFLLILALVLAAPACANIKMGGKVGASGSGGPTFFVLGAWAQPSSSFANWAARGINTQVSPTADFADGGASGAAAVWFATAATYNMKMIVGGRYEADGGYPPTSGSGGSWPSGPRLRP